MPSAPTLAAPDALTVIQNSVSLSPDNLRGPVTVDLVYHPTEQGKGTEHVLSWQIVAPTLDPLGSWLFVLRADSGEVLLRQNLLRSDSGQVFNPNPAKSFGGIIPPPDDCDSPGNESALSSEYASGTLRGINAGQDRLIGEFVDLSASGITGAYKPAAVADESSHNYVYGCNDDRFEEAAAAIRQSDTLLYGGAHVTTIDSAFAARGISATGAVSDFPYAYLRIIHPWRGDLDVQLQVGTDPSSPVCTVNVWDPSLPDSADDLVGFLDLNGSPCAAFLPPSPAAPWHFEVRDAFSRITGAIEQFEVVLSGTVRCIATDVPVAVPDNDGFVYSTVDCSTTASAPGDNDGDTVPDPIDTDDDNDGFSDTVELLVGAEHLDPCADTRTRNDEADDKWPPDLNDDQTANILDIVQLKPPAFGSDSTDPDCSARRDLNPDSVINILDIVEMTPPVFTSTFS